MKSARYFSQSALLASFLGISFVGGAAVDFAVPEEAEAGYDIDESYFYLSLSSDGGWVNNAQFGWVWYPYHRTAGWRPYTLGHWVWTDYGEWLWVSDEPFGWATYHYGRWFLDPFYGWVWLPGRVWAPAWVSWRDCDDYIGWAPIGPWGYYDRHNHRYSDWDRWHHDHNDWDDHRGYRHDRDDSEDWNFTRKRDFVSPRIDRVVLDHHRAVDVMRRSRDLPPPSEDDMRRGRGVSRGLGKDVIERAAGRPIHPVKVEDAAEPLRGGKDSAGAEHHGDRGDRVRVYRPEVREPKPDATPDRLGVAKAPGRANEGGARHDHGRADQAELPQGRDRSMNGPHGRVAGDESPAREPNEGRRHGAQQDAGEPAGRGHGPAATPSHEVRQPREPQSNRAHDAAVRPPRDEPHTYGGRGSYGDRALQPRGETSHGRGAAPQSSGEMERGYPHPATTPRSETMERGSERPASHPHEREAGRSYPSSSSRAPQYTAPEPAPREHGRMPQHEAPAVSHERAPAPQYAPQGIHGGGNRESSHGASPQSHAPATYSAPPSYQGPATYGGHGPAAQPSAPSVGNPGGGFGGGGGFDSSPSHGHGGGGGGGGGRYH